MEDMSVGVNSVGVNAGSSGQHIVATAEMVTLLPPRRYKAKAAGLWTYGLSCPRGDLNPHPREGTSTSS
ncbi:hypothetical protein BN13_30004 [Nostocoides jenkinsii Ben 74]|uniref:Uncharacterized protein n=1 Tax=Nostocoides jenkinsii Ben 74 TaxID=1193518 RepID=A0A077MDP9_9MICO|nr:hypothetical protein BN13_30004 [Tetrasphaera jenkinsii Ben 74]